ncbi:hypothetical protein AJ80_03039 [Polytolypa hystricis UAMH7299]|uniref:Alcohol acetyltransferase n=1 Tax=Polytolypa hystricis (strain UAMH7299) TaxID=1447883 RepID=A0A2B7YJ59_POLH7|nr:hypothetical protein AJ80_03039 [Polytolypa hystricis UAMH7299]
MESLEKLRPVGRLERYSTVRHHLGFYINVAVTATYNLPGSCAQPLKNYIYKACGTVVGQHPILSAIPVNEGTNNPEFVRLPDVDLDDCVFFQQRRGPTSTSDQQESDVSSSSHEVRDCELDALLSIQHNTPFTAPSPFWRLCILTDPEVPCRFTAALIYHHAIGDGGSGKAFHSSFQNALSKAVIEPSSGVISVIQSPKIPLLPNLEAIHPMSVTIPFLAITLFKAKIWSPRDPGLWTGSKVTIPLHNKVRHLSFSQSATTKLLHLCRENGSTLTAVLETVFAGALFLHLPETFSKLHCSGALSMRRWLSAHGITDECMGVWVQDFSEEYSRNAFQEENILPWPEAKRSRQTIENVLSLQGTNAGPNLLKYVHDYEKDLFLPKIGKERASSFEISNLGVFKKIEVLSESQVESQGEEERRAGMVRVAELEVEIGRMVFSQSSNVFGSALCVSAVTGGDGCLVLALTWQNGVVEDALVKQVIRSVENKITQLENQ